jgi:hypothetical protein
VERFSLGRSLLGSAAVVTLLLGCGGLNGPPFVSSGDNASALDANSGELLYVANDGASEGVSIVALPRGRRVARITNIGAPTGICSDASGNVWVSAYEDATHEYHLYKFARGGIKPTERLAVPDGSFGCSVDPVTGNLATWVASAGSAGEVEVFPGARRGKPIVYLTGFQPVSATYDNQGNIFADGIVNSGDFIFEELSKGSAHFSVVRLNKPAANPGSVQWDGKYVVVGVGFISDPPVLYRLRISDYRATVAQRISLQNLGSPARFWIADGNVVATQRTYAVRRIGSYDYPTGGQLAVFSGFYKPLGMTVSLPPK